MNQVHIGVIVPGMENGRIQPFQVQYTITQMILLIGIQILLNVSAMEPQKLDENKGTHILHTVLYYENVWLFHNLYFKHGLSLAFSHILRHYAFGISIFWMDFGINFQTEFQMNFCTNFWIGFQMNSWKAIFQWIMEHTVWSTKPI